MSPKEKAEELFKNYCNYVSAWTSTNKPNERPSAVYEGREMKYGRAKQCAIIAVEEIMLNEKNNHSILDKTYEYWENVLNELKQTQS